MRTPSVSRKRAFRSILHRIGYALYFKRAFQGTLETKIAGFSLSIWPSVMHPGFFRSGKFFAEYLLSQNFAGKTILDMGTGSGILAIAAAQKGATVLAIDKNKAAIQCATHNVSRNGLETKIRVIEGDFFDGLGKEEKFDIVLVNPPFLPGVPQSEFELALYGGPDVSLLDPFVSEVKSYLQPDGYILMVLSSDANIPVILDKFKDRGFSSTQIHSQKLFFETLYLFRLA